MASHRYPRRIEDIDLKAAEDGFIFYEAEKDRVHYLNHTAVLILELCDGRTSPQQIAELVRKAYDLDEAPVKEVDDTLARLLDEGLILPP